MSLSSVLAQIDADLDNSVDRLLQFTKIPSISTDPQYGADCRRAANWLKDTLAELGVEVALHDTNGHPMVVGHTPGQGRKLLFYGHYDVQPVDPIDLWDSDPFAPALQNTPAGKVIRGRGTSDDKGQLMTFIEACRAWKAVHGALPGPIIFFFEGEEESGSPSLLPFLNAHRELLSCDLALICDTGLFDHDTPAITTSLRGLYAEEITITGADKDLHSGLFGGPAINPIRVLSKILAGLHDDQGRVTLPGFYDEVPELDPSIAAQWDDLVFSPDDFLGSVGLSCPAGEVGKSALEMMWSRPTAEINGIWGGYTGTGFKTVLPAQAHAKISFRLVGQQDPSKIRAALHAQVRKALPPDCDVTFTPHGASKASQMAVSDPAFEAARQALSDEWPRPAAFIGGGGSIPIAGHFQDILGVDSMLIGFAKDDDQIHSPNEKYDLRSFHKGIRSWARILEALR